jgi:hypothetical protein
MRVKAGLLFVSLSFFVVNGYASLQEPVGVSPASEMGLARVSTICPTFSWTAVDGAVAYRVEVFQAGDSSAHVYNRLEMQIHPVLVKEIPGAATSWTPAAEERLGNGIAYVWFVQAVDEFGSGRWSQGRSFTIDSGLEFAVIEDALEETFEEHGLDKSVIDDVLQRVDEYTNRSDQSALSGDIPIRLQGNETGSNTYYGESAGFSLSTGYNNTFMGYQSGYSTSIGFNNTFLGYRAGYVNTNYHNTFVGAFSGDANTSGDHNTFVGYESGTEITTGDYNTVVGSKAGVQFTEGDNNVAIGYLAGFQNQTGGGNTFLGTHAGYNNNGNGNVFIGYAAGTQESGSSRLYIDNSNTTKPLIWGDFLSDILTFNGKIGVNTTSPAYPMELEKTGANASIVVDRTDGAMNFINATSGYGNFGTVNDFPLRLVQNGGWKMRLDTDRSLTMRNGATCTAGGVWTNASSRKLKENIHDITAAQALNVLNELRPVAYNYKSDKEDEHVGFIAEDVPDLVASKDRKGMSPMDVVAVLTKVVQELQKSNKEMQAEIAELRAKIDQDK